MVKGDHIKLEGQIPIQHMSPPNILLASQSKQIEEIEPSVPFLKVTIAAKT
jgi:hypothetical protein